MSCLSRLTNKSVHRNVPDNDFGYTLSFCGFFPEAPGSGDSTRRRHASRYYRGSSAEATSLFAVGYSDSICLIDDCFDQGTVWANRNAG